MKPRYFDSYFNADPMEELTEAAAFESGSYVVEDGGPMRRYRRISDNELSAVIYSGWVDIAQPVADLLSLGLGSPAEIYSPVHFRDDGGYSWRVSYVSASGELVKTLERHYSATRDIERLDRLGSDGKLTSYTVYHYHNGSLYELTTHAPDGSITSRQDA